MTPKYDNMVDMILENRDQGDFKYAGALQVLHKSNFFNPAKRYHFTNLPAVNLKTVEQPEPSIYNLKPAGLWYSIGDEWAGWLLNNMPQWTTRYIMEVEVNYPSMICVDPISAVENLGWKTVLDYNQFKQKYVIPKSFLQINRWDLVSQEFDGVENYYCGSDFGPWDIFSGCVWNPRGVRSIKLASDLETIEAKPFKKRSWDEWDDEPEPDAAADIIHDVIPQKG